MKRFREAEWLTWLPFNLYIDGDGEDKMFGSLLGGVMGLAPFFAVGSTMDALFLPTILAVLAGIVAAVFMIAIVTNLGRLSLRRGVSKTCYSLYTSDHEYLGTYSAEHILHRYFTLNEDERALYPKNFVNLLRDPDLDGEQMTQVLLSATLLHREIVRRRDVQEAVSKRVVDVSPVIEALERSRQGVQIDREVYQEFL